MNDIKVGELAKVDTHHGWFSNFDFQLRDFPGGPFHLDMKRGVKLGEPVMVLGSPVMTRGTLWVRVLSARGTGFLFANCLARLDEEDDSETR